MRTALTKSKNWRQLLARDARGGGAEDTQALSFLDEDNDVEIFFFPARFEFDLLR
jgi:hypothetical protein